MTKKTGIAIVAAGAVLIVSALLLFFHNRQEDAQAGQAAESLLTRVEAAIDTPSVIRIEPSVVTQPSAQTPREQPDEDEAEAEALPVVMLDGYAYIGVLDIPALELRLPVMAEWDYTRLQLAPCRQFGSTATDDLVIAAHNYQTHFGRLRELSPGDTVTFTDMDGAEIVYRVEKTQTLNPDEVDAVQNSGYALVLYTCTVGGKTRVTVFCSRAEAQAER